MRRDNEFKISPIGQDDINDENDVKKHILDVHSHSLESVLSKDFILSVLDKKEKDFIMKNVEAAFEARKIVRDATEAEYMKNRLLLKALTVANLNRNVKGNPIINAVLDSMKNKSPEDDLDVDKEIQEKLFSKERGRKK